MRFDEIFVAENVLNINNNRFIIEEQNKIINTTARKCGFTT